MGRVGSFPRIAARRADGLQVVLGAPTPLWYDRSPARASDVPAFVRAASAIRRVGSQLVVVQDDVNAVAMIDRGRARPWLLPRGRGGARAFDDSRRNKRYKRDFEAACVLPDGRMVLLGSGAAPVREWIAILRLGQRPRMRRATGMYARMRRLCQVAGQELNIEGALVQHERLRILQRGNGASRADLRAGGLVFDFGLADVLRWMDDAGPVPKVLDVVELRLGSLRGVPFALTDGATVGTKAIALLAAAEDSANVRSDGPVLGCRFAWWQGDRLEWTDIVDVEGRPVRLKLEGLEPRPRSTTEFDVVADPDRADQPAQLARLTVTEYKLSAKGHFVARGGSK